jgi:hypothetical protein
MGPAPMTARKPRPAPVAIPALPKAVAYPPDSIWRTWEEGKSTLFRGNLFKREGQRIARVIDSRTPRDT